MNYEEMLRRELTLIPPADEGAMARAAVYQGTLAKPPGSLGELENIYIRLCGITGTLAPGYTPCRIIVLCADNGVVEEGVSVTPRSVTAAQAVNMTRHCTGMSAMAHRFGRRGDGHWQYHHLRCGAGCPDGAACGGGYGPGRRHDRCGLPAEKAGHYPGLSPA